MQSGAVLGIIDSSFSGVSLNTIAPESGDRSLTSNVSIDSLPPHPRHLELELASADLERDLSLFPVKRLASVDHTSSVSATAAAELPRHRDQPWLESVIAVGVDR